MKPMKIGRLQNDDFYKYLLRRGINLEYYDCVMWSKEYLERFIESKTLDFEFSTSGLSITYNGVKKMILFLWVNHYDMETASQKMFEIVSNLSEDDLDEISKRSLKQTLKRLR
ncbi:MAG TPA: hypothetical protein VIK14_14070, partial [Ignavibacteria bacterium]